MELLSSYIPMIFAAIAVVIIVMLIKIGSLSNGVGI